MAKLHVRTSFPSSYLFVLFFFSKGMVSNPSPLVNMSKAIDKDGKKKEKET